MTNTWFGPRADCGCCGGGGCVCEDAWAEALATWSSIQMEVLGPGLTYPLNSARFLTDGTSCAAGISLLECESYVVGSTGLRYRLAGPSSCSISRLNTAAELGLWKASGTNRFATASCNGSSVAVPPGHRAGYGGFVSFGVDCVGGVPTWSLVLALSYFVEGSEGCNIGESYRITDPVAQGYTAITATRWEKANGPNRTSGMVTVTIGNEDKFLFVSDWYGTNEVSEIISTNLADIPTSLTISPFYNPAGATASFSLI